MSGISLITSDRRFWPLFWTQFSGALNDNVFKNALVILVTYKLINLSGLDPKLLLAAAGGVFIFPFFIFSATAGQLADKYEKSSLIRITKWTELLFMVAASIGFYVDNVYFLFSVLFLMGTQSAFFGPLKYGIIPSLVKDEELIQGNAFVSTGTFIAILLGTIVGGKLATFENFALFLSVGVCSLSLVGIVASRFIEKVPVVYPDIKVDYTLFKPTWDILKLTMKNGTVFKTVLGISWFWFLGAAILTVLPVFASDVMNGKPDVAILFTALFTIGMGLGSFLVSKISDKRVEIGIVPTAGVVMGLFIMDLYFVSTVYDLPVNPVSIGEFIVRPWAWRVVVDLIFIATFGGLYMVPQMTFIQEITDKGELARTIAGNNIWNALFMVTSSLIIGAMMKGLGIAKACLYLGLIQLVVSYIVYWFYSEHAARFWMGIISKAFYRVTIKGKENLPEGPFILASNHISFVDWVILMGALKDPIRFVIDYNYYYMPMGPFWFRQAKLVPIATKKEDPEVLKKAFDKIGEHLDEGAILGIFPEGWISRDGKMRKFQPGIHKILKNNPVPVVIIGLDGLWGSIFSYHGGKVIFKWPNIFKRREVTVTINPPIKAEDYCSKEAEKIMISAVSDYKKNGQEYTPSGQEQA